jgi:WD40 repeat protein
MTRMPLPGLFRAVSGWNRKRELRLAAAAANTGNTESVRSLARLLSDPTQDPGRDAALAAIRSLDTPESVDIFCTEVLSLGDDALLRLAAENGYLPSDAGLKALFLFVTGQTGKYLSCDPGESHPLLGEAYRRQAPCTQRFIRRKARSANLCSPLAGAIAGPDVTRYAAGWCAGEWECVRSGLAGSGLWDELWKLVFCAPPPESVACLHAIRASGWVPPADDRIIFDSLMDGLPSTWLYPQPHSPAHGTCDLPASRPVRLAFSCDNSLLACGCRDGTVHIWDTRSGVPAATVNAPAGLHGPLFFSSDGRQLFGILNDGSLCCWDARLGTLCWTFHDTAVNAACLAPAPDSDVILAAGPQNIILALQAADGSVRGSVRRPVSPAPCVAASLEGNLAACAGGDGTITLHWIGDGAVVREFHGRDDAVVSCVFSSDSSELIIQYAASGPMAFSVSSGEILWSGSGPIGRAACSAASGSGTCIAAGSADNTLRIWQRHDRRPSAAVPFYNHRVTCCAVDTAGKHAVAGCSDGTLRILDLPSGRAAAEKKVHAAPFATLAISPDGRLLADAAWDGTVCIRSMPSCEPLRTLRHPAGVISCMAQLVGDSRIITGWTGGSVMIIRGGDGARPRTLDMYTRSVTALAVSPDGSRFACAGTEPSLRIWDLENGSLAVTCEGLSASVRCLAFMPDGLTLISGGWDGKVTFWDTLTGKPSTTLAGHSSTITSCALSPDGSILATGSNDTTVRLWSPAAGTLMATIAGARHEISAIAFSPDGRLLAAGGSDAVLRLDFLPDGCPESTIPGLPGTITALAFAPCGDLIFAGYETGVIACFSLRESRIVRTYPAHTAAVTGLCTDETGHLLVSAGRDGRVRVENLPFVKPLAEADYGDFAGAVEEENCCTDEPLRQQWAFLRRMLGLRFRYDIGLCSLPHDAGAYDIQIIG